MFLYSRSDYSVDSLQSVTESRLSRHPKNLHCRGTCMKPNTALSTKTLRTGLAAAAATLSVSAASLGDDSQASKHHVLPASTDNVQWGWYDINEKPKLTIKS